MYRILLIVLIVMGIIQKVDSQWSNLPSKTKLYFSSFRYKIRESLNDDDTAYKKKEIFSVIIDTVINLNASNSKMTVFSRCLNSLLFNTTCQVIRGDLTKNDINLMEPSYLTDGVKDYAPGEATVIYQVNADVYALTVSKDFFKEKMRDDTIVKKFDSLLLSIIDTSEMRNIGSNYIYFDGYNFPIRPLLKLKYGNVNTQNVDNNESEDYPYFLFKKQIKENNKFYGIVNLYEQTSRSWVLGKLSLSKYGIINSESVAPSRKYVYYNETKLSKIELPK